MDASTLRARLQVIESKPAPSAERISDLARPTQELYDRELRDWESFKIAIENPDLRPDLGVLCLFVEWFVANSPGRLSEYPTIDTLLWKVGRLSCALRRKYGYQNSPETLNRVRNYIQNTMTDEFGLVNPSYEKSFATAEDIAEMLDYLWCADTHEYNNERLRIQIALYLVLLEESGGRPGAILRSDCYRGENDALNYEDMNLQIKRHGDGIKLEVDITFRLMKGKRQESSSFLKISVPEDTETPQHCPIRMFLALCFLDDVFDNETIKTPQDLMALRVPPSKHAISVPFKKKVLSMPVFRAMVTRGSNLISDIKAWSTGSGLQQVQRVAKAAGFPQRFTPYSIRRGVSNRLEGKCTTPQKLHILGHGNTTIWAKYYLSQHTSVEIGTIFRGRATTRNEKDDVRGMRVEQDTDAPQKALEEDIELALSQDQKIQEILRLRAATWQKIHSTQNAAELVKLREELAQHRRDISRQREYLKRKLGRQHRLKWFENRNKEVIDASLSGFQIEPVKRDPLPPNRVVATTVLYPEAGQKVDVATAVQGLVDFCNHNLQLGPWVRQMRKRSSPDDSNETAVSRNGINEHKRQRLIAT